MTVQEELDNLKRKVRQYLERPSTDGHQSRVILRAELKALVDDNKKQVKEAGQS